MTSKEIWTIDDIIEDYVEKGGMANRSKIDFLEDVKDMLEDYEELKKLMRTPVQDIMKRLKVLEIFKKILMLKITIGVDKVDAEIPSDKIIFKLDELNNEEKDIIWEWLGEWLNE